MNRVFVFFPTLLLLGGGILLVEGPDVDVDWWNPPWSITSPDVDAPGDPDGDNGIDDDDDGTPGDIDADDGTDDTGGDDDGNVDVCQPRDVVGEFLATQGFDRGDYVIGAANIDWSLLSASHVDRSFTTSLRTESAVREFLDGDSAEGRAARDAAGDDVDDWVPVQFQNPVKYTGNWNWDGHRATKGGDLMVFAGDVWWIGVDTDDCYVDLDGSVRAVCGNVGVGWIRPFVRRD